jgi:hypothetical protein
LVVIAHRLAGFIYFLNIKNFYCVKTTSEVWYDYPVSDKDNEVASLLLHEDVGKFIALGGGASHLEEAVSRIEKVKSEHSDHPAYASIMDLESKTNGGKKQVKVTTRRKGAIQNRQKHHVNNINNFVIIDWNNILTRTSRILL